MDLPYLIGDYQITAIDLTPAMLNQLQIRAAKLEMNINILEMDGQNLQFENNSFDCVILNLILAVIPDPKKCIAEAERVLKFNGI